MRIVALSCIAALSGCAYLQLLQPDSPTEWTQAAPVRIAASDETVIFKSAGESYNCGLGGDVAFASATIARKPTRDMRFSYTVASSKPRDDLVQFVRPDASLSVRGSGSYRLVTKNGPTAWQSLGKLKTLVAVHGPAGTAISIARAPRNRYIVAVASRTGDNFFRGTVIPLAGVVYIRDAIIAARTPIFSGTAQHNCGNWDSADEATKALGRVEARIPK